MVIFLPSIIPALNDIYALSTEKFVDFVDDDLLKLISVVLLGLLLFEVAPKYNFIVLDENDWSDFAVKLTITFMEDGVTIFGVIT